MKNPIKDVTYNWLTTLQSKAEALNAYEKYIKDAKQAKADECVKLFEEIQEQDRKQVIKIRKHLMSVMQKSDSDQDQDSDKMRAVGGKR